MRWRSSPTGGSCCVGAVAVAEPFVHTLRVRYGECDAQSVVFNAHYLSYFDISVTELWRAAFGSYQAVIERGIDVVVAEAQVRFLRPARSDQLLELEIAVTHLGTTSIVSRHRVRHDGELLVEGITRHVSVDPETLGKTPIPEWLRAGLAPWTIEAEGPRPTP
jgi:acyl-CoA thioester hydrolase